MYDLEEFIKHMDYGKETNLEIIEVFIRTGRSDLARLEEAINSGDAGAAAAAAHSIKGAAASLGLMGIYSRARAIEERARSGSATGIQEGLQAIAEDLDQIVELAEDYGSDSQKTAK